MNVPDGFPKFKLRAQCVCSNRTARTTESGVVAQSHSANCPLNKQLRSTVLSRNTPIRKKAKSDKALREGRLKEGSKEWKAEREKVVKRSGGWCEAKVPNVCQKRAVDPHHVKTRARGGSDYADNLLAVCRACHDWIDVNQVEATEMGLLKHSWDGAA